MRARVLALAAIVAGVAVGTLVRWPPGNLAGVAVLLLPAAGIGRVFGDPVGIVAGRVGMQLCAALDIVLVHRLASRLPRAAAPLIGPVANGARWWRPFCMPSCRPPSPLSRPCCSPRWPA